MTIDFIPAGTKLVNEETQKYILDKVKEENYAVFDCMTALSFNAGANFMLSKILKLGLIAGGSILLIKLSKKAFKEIKHKNKSKKEEAKFDEFNFNEFKPDEFKPN